MENILNCLLELGDDKYAEFQAKTVPNISSKTIIGVRLPELRKFAKQIKDEKLIKEFLSELPHKYYDENMLHSILISNIKNVDECYEEIDRFLPFVDNWAVCDTIKPKILTKQKDRLIKEIKRWTASKETYTCRFGMEALMMYFLDEDYKSEYLEIPAMVHSEEYYVQMMQAWFFATALAKQWDSTICILENKLLDKWTHNKTIQKAKESYRITDEQKLYLNTLKIK